MSVRCVKKEDVGISYSYKIASEEKSKRVKSNIVMQSVIDIKMII